MDDVKFEDLMRISDIIIMKPNKTLSDACIECGVNTQYAHVMGAISPMAMASINIVSYFIGLFHKNKIKQEEKERMTKEIIRKQQATINKLKEQIERNRQEIHNLIDALDLLNSVLVKMEKV